jgi:nucleotide-binding universal stress UspA family protein
VRLRADGLQRIRTYARTTPEKEPAMTVDSPSPRIVVGYDGSPASRAAVARAAHRAGGHGQVYIVHAYSLPMDWYGIPDYQRLLDIELNRAQDLVGRLEEQSGADLSGTSWETEIIGAAPANAIADVAAARDADEIIIGTRGHGRARALLGSVAHELIHLADCPVTVIPERAVAGIAARAKAGAAA